MSEHDNANAELRNRRQPARQPNVNDRPRLNRPNNQNRCIMQICYLIIFLVIFLFLVSYIYNPEKVDEPETSVMCKYRAVCVDLGTTLGSSEIVTTNGAKISRTLFELSEHYKVAGEEISKFKWQAEFFFYELNDIINREEGFWDINYEDDIRKKVRELKNDMPDLQEQLGRVIKAFKFVGEKSIQSQSYLITGDREAQKVMNQHSFGNITDYERKKQAIKERKEILYVYKLIKVMLPDFFNFQEFLELYDKQLQDIDAKFDLIYATQKPSKKEIKKLISAAKYLKTSHNYLSGNEKRLEPKPKDHPSFNEEEDCTKFKLQFRKSHDVYLDKISIWSLYFINAIAFYYSDGSVEIFGRPAEFLKPFDFEWHKGEKIKRISYNFGDNKLYGLEITTTKGRSTGWHGGHGGQLSYPVMMGKEFNGLFISHSEHICSIEGLETETVWSYWLYDFLF